jgi:transposase
MVAMNELNPVHMPSPEHREFRSLVKYRKSLDQRINKLKNTIGAWFVNHGTTIDTGDVGRTGHKARHTAREPINSFRTATHKATVRP